MNPNPEELKIKSFFSELFTQTENELNQIYEYLKKKSDSQNIKKNLNIFPQDFDYLERKHSMSKELNKIFHIKSKFEGSIEIVKKFNNEKWEISKKEEEFKLFYQKFCGKLNDIDIIINDDYVLDFINFEKTRIQAIEAKFRTQIEKKKEEFDKCYSRLSKKNQEFKKNQEEPNNFKKIIDFLERKQAFFEDYNLTLSLTSYINGLLDCSNNLNVSISIKDNLTEIKEKTLKLDNLATDKNFKEIIEITKEEINKIGRNTVDLQKNNLSNLKTIDNDNKQDKKNKKLENTENMAELKKISYNQMLKQSPTNELKEIIAITKDQIVQIESNKNSAINIVEDPLKSKENASELSKKAFNSNENSKANRNSEDLFNNLKILNIELVNNVTDNFLKEKKKKMKESFEIEKKILEQNSKDQSLKIKKLEAEKNELIKTIDKFREIPKDLKKFKESFDFNMDSIANNLNLVQKNFNNLAKNHLKLVEKFKTYQIMYKKYYSNYMSSNLIENLKKLIIHDRDYAENKIIYETLKDSNNGFIELLLPEQYKYIDRDYMEQKIDIILVNIMNLNEFAKVFLKIMIFFYPKPTSNDINSKNITKGFNDIHLKLKSLNDHMKTEHLSILQKYRDSQLEVTKNKNYVDIFDKCLDLENYCINEILSLDGNFFFFIYLFNLFKKRKL